MVEIYFVFPSDLNKEDYGKQKKPNKVRPTDTIELQKFICKYKVVNMQNYIMRYYLNNIAS